MVVLRRGPNGLPTVWCDPCIADLVGALNAGGLPTVASCCGHHLRDGSIVLVDGRELLVRDVGREPLAYAAGPENPEEDARP